MWPLGAGGPDHLPHRRVGGESPNQARADYLDQLGLGANPVQQVKTFLEASILVQASLGIAPLPEGMERNLSRDVSVFSIEGDSFRIRTVALRLLPSVSLAGDHFFQLIREDQAASKGYRRNKFF